MAPITPQNHGVAWRIIGRPEASWMTYDPNQTLGALLRDVSRSFYLTLRVLPRSVRPQVSLAYLLARTTDTIADTALVAIHERLTTLGELRERIIGTTSAPLKLGDLAQHQGSPAERVLLERCDTALTLLRALTRTDHGLVVEVLKTIISGQELDLRRFGNGSASNIVALQTAADLDDYTYRVAGCVGEFWTRICRAHVYPAVRLDDAFLLTSGVRFGKGLQLVNILRDLPRDLRNGRCYLPAEELAAAGLKPTDLLEPAAEPRLRPVYNAWLERAAAHLSEGWSYTTALPRASIRVRLACAWPLLLGARTVALLRNGRILEPGDRIRVTRSEVRRILWRSVFYYPFRARWEGLYQQSFSSH